MSVARIQLTLNAKNLWDLEVVEDGSISNCQDIESILTAVEIAKSYCYDEYGLNILFDVVRSTRTHIIYDVHSKRLSKSA